jgi:hypothetical protein
LDASTSEQSAAMEGVGPRFFGVRLFLSVMFRRRWNSTVSKQPSTADRLLNHNLTILVTLRPIQPSNRVSSLSALVLLRASTEFKEPCRWINHWQRPFLGVWIWPTSPLHRCLILQQLGMFYLTPSHGRSGPLGGRIAPAL